MIHCKNHHASDGAGGDRTGTIDTIGSIETKNEKNAVFVRSGPIWPEVCFPTASIGQIADS